MGERFPVRATRILSLTLDYYHVSYSSAFVPIIHLLTFCPALSRMCPVMQNVIFNSLKKGKKVELNTIRCSGR